MTYTGVGGGGEGNLKILKEKYNLCEPIISK